MKTFKIHAQSKQILADIITPVSIYLKIRDIYPESILLESSDYHSHTNSYSFICLDPVATFMTSKDELTEIYPGKEKLITAIDENMDIVGKLDQFIQSFKIENGEHLPIDGLFGYSAYDAVKYFEELKINNPQPENEYIPEIRYSFYRFVIAVNHFKNELHLIEFLFDGMESQIDDVQSLLHNRNFATYNFAPTTGETSNLDDKEYMNMVKSGKQHCQRGDVFQIVLSRQFTQPFKGDDFNVYRALRSVNPSPYLFYFDYGNYKIFGSSPETQIEVRDNQAFINPIAGTFKRTGDDIKDKELAEKLSQDPKENAEHIMLVDLARNDLSRTTTNVSVEKYREIQYYSHVLHMVSKVSGELKKDASKIRIMSESFPAGTLSGAPKFRAMELIDEIENKKRGYYGGCIGNIRLNGDINQAIMIRSFMSKNNQLYYQAGAGIVVDSEEESELQEVNNKLGALKTAIKMAAQI
ncbi:MAG: anthranilate synthase component I family protein [Bacteroidota bacterium]